MSAPDHDLPILTTSLAVKINMGNYQSADIFLSVGNVTRETPREEIEQLVDVQGAVIYDVIRKALHKRVAQAKAAQREKIVSAPAQGAKS